MFRPLMLAIIRLFDMNTYQLVIQVYGLLCGPIDIFLRLPRAAPRVSFVSDQHWYAVTVKHSPHHITTHILVLLTDKYSCRTNDDGQHQWPKHVVVVIYVIKHLTHSNQLRCVWRTDTYYIYCLWQNKGDDTPQELNYTRSIKLHWVT
jgi:hypothetical protein